MTPAGETSTLDLPIAEAGLGSDPDTGEPYLVASQAETASSGVSGLRYSWLINGEKHERPYFDPCLGDLPAGQYTANLYIRKHGVLLASDTLNFSLPAYAGDLDSESDCNLSGAPAQTPDSSMEQAIP